MDLEEARRRRDNRNAQRGLPVPAPKTCFECDGAISGDVYWQLWEDGYILGNCHPECVASVDVTAVLAHEVSEP